MVGQFNPSCGKGPTPAPKQSQSDHAKVVILQHYEATVHSQALFLPSLDGFYNLAVLAAPGAPIKSVDINPSGRETFAPRAKVFARRLK